MTVWGTRSAVSRKLHGEKNRMKPLKLLFENHWKSILTACAIGSDAMAIVVSILLPAAFLNDGSIWAGELLPISGLLGLSIVVFLSLRLSVASYRSVWRISRPIEYRLAFRAYLYGTFIVVGIYFVYPSESYQLTFLALLPALYVCFRLLFWKARERIQERGFGRYRTLVIGHNPHLRRILRWASGLPEYDIVGVIERQIIKGEGSPIDIDTLEETIQREGVDLVLLSQFHVNGSRESLERICRAEGTHMRIIPPEADHLYGRDRIWDIAALPLLLSSGNRPLTARVIIKRMFDLAGALVLTLALSPLLIFVAVATKLESPGPILFKQKRCLNGSDTPIDVFKFRSMRVEAPDLRTSLKNESNGALFKVRDDPRVTRIGRLIRRYSVDELPQLINIFKGEMSLVGPRPLPLEDFRYLDENDDLCGLYRHRSGVKPGLTGLWQVSGRSDLGFPEMVLLDVYYVENHSLLFDLEILLHTIPAVLFAKGAY